MLDTALFDDIFKQLQQLHNPQRALYDQAYHKSKRIHWGVCATDCKNVVKKISKVYSHEQLLLVAKRLWETNLFDPMICAARILACSKVHACDEVWKSMISFLEQVDGWALEDTLAPAAWKCILHNEAYLDVLQTWTTHSNFWMRRATLVYTLVYAKKGMHVERICEWMAQYSGDSEWFIQKAIGWWLRVLGKSHPDKVMLFLRQHGHHLKSVAKHEATRILDPVWKQQL